MKCEKLNNVESLKIYKNHCILINYINTLNIFLLIQSRNKAENVNETKYCALEESIKEAKN